MFTPTKGMFFYVKVRPQKRYDRDVMSGNVITSVQEDGSYSEDIFVALATDDTMLVARRCIQRGSFVKLGSMFGGDLLFRKARYIFEPLGPAVTAYYGLETAPDAEDQVPAGTPSVDFSQMKGTSE